MEVLAIVMLLAWACCGGFGAWIAAQKGRSASEGAIVGVLFGPLGCVVEALLPVPDEDETPAPRASRDRWAEPVSRADRAEDEAFDYLTGK